MTTLRVANVPDDLKERFRTICKRRGMTMSHALLEFVKEAVGEEILQEAADRFRRRRFRR